MDRRARNREASSSDADASEPPKPVGWATMSDGTHRRLSADEIGQILGEIKAKDERLASTMPDVKAALAVLADAYERLKQLGFNDAIYCPKDGTVFEVIEAGSTGIHRAHYDGVWPTGSWWVHGDGDLWPSRPILFRLLTDTPEGVKASPAEDPTRPQGAEGQ